MFESDWLKYVPNGTLEGGIGFLNRLSWNIHWRQDGILWKAFAGDRLLVATHTEDELKAFVQGMTIGLAVLPGPILDAIRNVAAE